MVRQLAIPTLRLEVAVRLFPRGNDGAALQRTDGRIRLLAVVGELEGATRQARGQEKQENQAHAWLLGLHEPRLLPLYNTRIQGSVRRIPASSLGTRVSRSGKEVQGMKVKSHVKAGATTTTTTFGDTTPSIITTHG
jgi:hypothetical protein